MNKTKSLFKSWGFRKLINSDDLKRSPWSSGNFGLGISPPYVAAEKWRDSVLLCCIQGSWGSVACTESQPPVGLFRLSVTALLKTLRHSAHLLCDLWALNQARPRRAALLGFPVKEEPVEAGLEQPSRPHISLGHKQGRVLLHRHLVISGSGRSEGFLPSLPLFRNTLLMLYVSCPWRCSVFANCYHLCLNMKHSIFLPLKLERQKTWFCVMSVHPHPALCPGWRSPVLFPRCFPSVLGFPCDFAPWVLFGLFWLSFLSLFFFKFIWKAKL